MRQRTGEAIKDIWSALASGIDNLPISPITQDGNIDEKQVSQAAGKLLGYDSNFLQLLEKERGYRSSLSNWNKYQEWKQNRNPARAEMEAKFGYDGKHAYHLIRLMRMCKEILTSGKVIVKRPDAEELLAIRNGAWTYDQLIEWAEKQEAEVDAIYKSGKSPLPKTPNQNKIDALCQTIVEKALKENK